nr:tyrosine-type recombinase/integrase [Microbulbifer sp. CAU 1566]
MALAGGAKGTIQLKVGTLKTIFDDAVDKHDDLVTANPFAKVGIFGKAKRGKIPFKDKELRALLAVDDDYFTRALAFSGMRGGELCALRGTDIKTDEDTGIMYFDITKSKTEAGVRRIPVHPLLAEWASDKAGDPGLLYQGKIKPDKPQRSTEFMNRRKDRAGIQSEATTHSLRGLFATGLEQANVRSETIKRLMGHVQQDLAFSDYSKGLTLIELKEAVEQLSTVGCYRALTGVV